MGNANCVTRAYEPPEAGGGRAAPRKKKSLRRWFLKKVCGGRQARGRTEKDEPDKTGSSLENRAATIEGQFAAFRIQKQWRDYYAQIIRSATRPSTEENIKVMVNLQKCWPVIESLLYPSTPNHLGLCMFRPMIKLGPELMVKFPFHREERKMIAYSDSRRSFPHFSPNNSMTVVFRGKFHVQEDMLKLSVPAIGTFMMRAITNDDGEKIPRVSREVVLYADRKDRKGHTFVADARIVVELLQSGVWRVGITGYLSTLLAQLRNEVSGSLSNSKNIIPRGKFHVQEDMPKLSVPAIGTFMMRAITHDDGEKIPHVSREVVLYAGRKDRKGRTFVADARIVVELLKSGVWRVGITGYLSTLLAQLRNEVSGSTSNSKNIVLRYAANVTEEHQTSIQMIMSKTDVKITLLKNVYTGGGAKRTTQRPSLNNDEKVASTLGKGHVVIPAFAFLKDVYPDEVTQRSTPRPSLNNDEKVVSTLDKGHAVIPAVTFLKDVYPDEAANRSTPRPSLNNDEKMASTQGKGYADIPAVTFLKGVFHDKAAQSSTPRPSLNNEAEVASTLGKGHAVIPSATLIKDVYPDMEAKRSTPRPSKKEHSQERDKRGGPGNSNDGRSSSMPALSEIPSCMVLPRPTASSPACYSVSFLWEQCSRFRLVFFRRGNFPSCVANVRVSLLTSAVRWHPSPASRVAKRGARRAGPHKRGTQPQDEVQPRAANGSFDSFIDELQSLMNANTEGWRCSTDPQLRAQDEAPQERTKLPQCAESSDLCTSRPVRVLAPRRRRRSGSRGTGNRSPRRERPPDGCSDERRRPPAESRDTFRSPSAASENAIEHSREENSKSTKRKRTNPKTDSDSSDLKKIYNCM